MLCIDCSLLPPGDSTNSTSSQGAEGGVSVSSEATTDGPELHSDQLLEEIQKEIDRLKLLGPEGEWDSLPSSKSTFNQCERSVQAGVKVSGSPPVCSLVRMNTD